MREIKTSGLPIYLNEIEYDLTFHGNLTCTEQAKKKAGQLKNLLYTHEAFNEDELCYKVYRDIYFNKDQKIFKKFDFRYDITLIMPGTIQSECKKTSGHYHGYHPIQPFTFPEVYEVLVGKAIYVLQKVSNFDIEGEEPIIEDLKAVIVEAGQAIVIPPFYGHCSINAGEGPMVFSNIAVVSCPLFYEPIQRKHGLSIYVLNDKNELVFKPNPNYQDIPDVNVVYPKENPSIGITFNKPVYQAFINDPQKFDFLLNPGPSIREMERMLI